MAINTVGSKSAPAIESSLPNCYAIDIGSNACRMGLAHVDDQHRTEEVHLHREPLSIMEAVQAHSGDLPRPTEQQLFRFLERSLSIAEENGLRPDDGLVVATAGMRAARNSDRIVRRVREQLGIHLEVLDGMREAYLSAQAAVSEIEPLKHGDKNGLVIEFGGGSVQASWVSAGTVQPIGSYPVGGRVLLSEFKGPVESVKNMQHTRKRLEPLCKDVREAIASNPVHMLVGLGGVAKELQSLRYNALVPSVTTLSKLSWLLRKTLASVREILLHRPDRKDVVIPGAHVFTVLQEISGAKEFVAPSTGLREGLYIEAFRRKQRG